jgi:hypothetical protein
MCRANNEEAQAGFFKTKQCSIDVERWESAVEWVSSLMPKGARLLTFSEAIEGAESLGVEPMNLSTSAGYPRTGTKFDWLMADGKKDVENFIRTSDCAPFALCLKDELRPERKKGVPRAFVCVPPEVIVTGRMLCSHADALIASECKQICVGMNPFNGGFCREFARADRTAKFLCGDYKSWDQSLHPYFAEALVRIRERMMHAPGTREALERYYHVIFNQSMVNAIGESFNRSGGMPSGMCSTAIDNSILNLAVLRYVLGDFADVWVYGDDHVVQLLKPIPDMVTEMARLGLTYTDAQKRSEVSECSFEDIEFLKLKPGVQGRHIIPLRVDSERIGAILEYHRTPDLLERIQRAFVARMYNLTAKNPEIDVAVDIVLQKFVGPLALKYSEAHQQMAEQFIYGRTLCRCESQLGV